MMMAGLILRCVLGLWTLQVVAGALVHMAYDWRPLSVPLTLLYLLVAMGTARSLSASIQPAFARLGAAALVAALWQLPALLGSLNFLREYLGLTPYDGNSDLLDFAAQTWQIPLMPVLGLFPGRGADLMAGYYLGLIWAPPIVCLLYLAVAARPAVQAERPEQVHERSASNL